MAEGLSAGLSGLEIQDVIFVDDGLAEPFLLVPVIHDDEAADTFVGGSAGIDACDSDAQSDTDRIAH